MLLAGSTYLGRRAPVGFVALFTFLGFSGRHLHRSGCPSWSWPAGSSTAPTRSRRRSTARIRADRGPEAAPSAAPPPRQSRAEMAAARRAERAGGRKKGPAGPEGNKRYTPEEADPAGPPPPKPSLAERQAAKSAQRLTGPPAGAAHAASVTRAERSSSRISLRRRTSDRAVGSSPKARSTSTSVSMPMTVE